MKVIKFKDINIKLGDVIYKTNSKTKSQFILRDFMG